MEHVPACDLQIGSTVEAEEKAAVSESFVFLSLCLIFLRLYVLRTHALGHV